MGENHNKIRVFVFRHSVVQSPRWAQSALAYLDMTFWAKYAETDVYSETRSRTYARQPAVVSIRKIGAVQQNTVEYNTIQYNITEYNKIQ